MLKRLFDLVVATTGLVVLSPVMAAVSLAVKLTTPGPVFFRQERVGRHGRLFRIYKFRTMVDDAETRGGKLTVGGDGRVTAVGRFLRRHKLDELPQLINVVRGEMSLVGPRPEVPEYVARFAGPYARVLSVRPGITHRATLWFRNEEALLAASTDPDVYYLTHVLPLKLKFYLEGLERQSFLDDLKTIVWTVLDAAHALTAEEVARAVERLPAALRVPEEEAVLVANLGPAGLERGERVAAAEAGSLPAEERPAPVVEPVAEPAAVRAARDVA